MMNDHNRLSKRILKLNKYFLNLPTSVQRLAVVSSLGADPASSNSCPGIKGEMEIGRLGKYKGIWGKDVAKVMIKAINDQTGIQILESDIIHQISLD